MSFTGNLEDLAIVDVVQLLHTTRKSGTLCVKGKKGEGQLVFQDGLIISARHPDKNLRTGDYLVAMNFISKEILEEALSTQKQAGKPLIATLIEQGKIKQEEAYKALETLVDMTVVEMVRWTRGTFTLDVDVVAVDDEFSYFPDNLVLDTQMVLMDALRIFDEKTRDGEFQEDDSLESEAETPPATGRPPLSDAESARSAAAAPVAEAPAAEAERPDLSPDDLGLSDFDLVEKKVPDVFTPLEIFDPSDIHRQVIKKALPDVPTERQEKLVEFLIQHSANNQHDSGARQSRAVVLFSRDELVKHAIMTICKQDQIMVFAKDNEDDLDQAIEQALTRGLATLIVIDKADSMDDIGLLTLQQRKIVRYAQIPVIQLGHPMDYGFSLQSLKNGVRTVLPKPTRSSREKTFIDDYLHFLKAFRIYVDRCFSEQSNQALNMLGQYIANIQNLTEARDISYSLLQAVAGVFDRSITLILNQSSLIAERGIGTGVDTTRALQFRIPLTAGSIFNDVVGAGKPYYGSNDDKTLSRYLYSEISAPHSPNIILLPIKNRGRTIALIYGDYGTKEAQPLHLEPLVVLADLASLALENSFYLKQLEKLKK
jgi:hypothetical protein